MNKKLKGLPLDKESKAFRKFLRKFSLIKIVDTGTFQQYMSTYIISKMNSLYNTKEYIKIKKDMEKYLKK